MVQIRFRAAGPVHIMEHSPPVTFKLDEPLSDELLAQRTRSPGTQLLIGTRKFLFQLLDALPRPARLFCGTCARCSF